MEDIKIDKELKAQTHKNENTEENLEEQSKEKEEKENPLTEE